MASPVQIVELVTRYPIHTATPLNIMISFRLHNSNAYNCHELLRSITVPAHLKFKTSDAKSVPNHNSCTSISTINCLLTYEQVKRVNPTSKRALCSYCCCRVEIKKILNGFLHLARQLLRFSFQNEYNLLAIEFLSKIIRGIDTYLPFMLFIERRLLPHCIHYQIK